MGSVSFGSGGAWQRLIPMEEATGGRRAVAWLGGGGHGSRKMIPSGPAGP
jgi:hypothetical protein